MWSMFGLVVILGRLASGYGHRGEPVNSCSSIDFQERMLQKMIHYEHSVKTTLDSINTKLEEFATEKAKLLKHIETFKVGQKEEFGALKDTAHSAMKQQATQHEQFMKHMSSKYDSMVEQTDRSMQQIQSNAFNITQELQADAQRNQANMMKTGSTYNRWGRISCPDNGTELVYTGFMAGNKWNSYGGGSNTLCLSYPTWNKYSDADNGGSHVHGTEIEIPDSLSMTLFGKHASNMNMPCAVCRSTRASSLMIPARANCFSGWHTEYSGYLVSSHHAWKASSDYSCLDENPDFLPGENMNDDEHVVKVVEMITGARNALPPPQFVNYREVACVVCSK